MELTCIRYVSMVVSLTMDCALESQIPLAGDGHEITQYNRDSHETTVKRFKLTQEIKDRYISLIGKYGIEDQAGKIQSEPAVFKDGHSHAVSFLILCYDDGSEKKVAFRETDASCKEAAEEFRKLFFSVTSDENLISETLEYPTLKQCRELKEEHGPVVAVETSFFSSGMMYGSNQSVVQLVEKVEGIDGMVRVTVRKKAGNEPEVSDSRELRSDILAKVQEISDRENIPCWHYACIDPSIPVDRSMMPLDYSSHGCVNIYYDDSLITGCPRIMRTIGESACKMGGKEVDSLLSKMVCDCVTESGVDVKMPDVKIQNFSTMGMGQDPSLTKEFEGIRKAQEAAVGAPAVQKDAHGTWTCDECGQAGNTGKFCPNCGAQRKEEKTFICDCGYKGSALRFCPDCGRKISDNTAPAAPAVPVRKPDAGPEIPDETAILFSISTFSSCNPPVTTSAIVYEYSDTQILFDNNGQRRLISADVIEPAMEIIRKHRLDDRNFKEPTGIMGGSVYVTFKNGDSYIHTSLQEQGFAVSAAQSELIELFNNA